MNQKKKKTLKQNHSSLISNNSIPKTHTHSLSLFSLSNYHVHPKPLSITSIHYIRIIYSPSHHITFSIFHSVLYSENSKFLIFFCKSLQVVVSSFFCIYFCLKLPSQRNCKRNIDKGNEREVKKNQNCLRLLFFLESVHWRFFLCLYSLISVRKLSILFKYLLLIACFIYATSSHTPKQRKKNWLKIFIFYGKKN